MLIECHELAWHQSADWTCLATPLSQTVPMFHRQNLVLNIERLIEEINSMKRFMDKKKGYHLTKICSRCKSICKIFRYINGSPCFPRPHRILGLIQITIIRLCHTLVEIHKITTAQIGESTTGHITTGFLWTEKATTTTTTMMRGVHHQGHIKEGMGISVHRIPFHWVHHWLLPYWVLSDHVLSPNRTGSLASRAEQIWKA